MAGKRESPVVLEGGEENLTPGAHSNVDKHLSGVEDEETLRWGHRQKVRTACRCETEVFEFVDRVPHQETEC